MCSEIGEAVDFADEMLGKEDYPHVSASAAPLVPAGTAVFGLRFQGAVEPSLRSIEIAIHARSQPVTLRPKTEIALLRENGSVTLVAAPRSGQLTRFLLVNMLEAVRDRAPSKLLYSPTALQASRELLLSAVERLDFAR